MTTARRTDFDSARRMLGLGAMDWLSPPTPPTEAVRAALPAEVRAYLAALEAEVARAAPRGADYVAQVAHELRTPLTSIVGYLSVVLDERAARLPDESRELLEVARRNADRL